MGYLGVIFPIKKLFQFIFAHCQFTSFKKFLQRYDFFKLRGMVKELHNFTLRLQKDVLKKPLHFTNDRLYRYLLPSSIKIWYMIYFDQLKDLDVE